MILVFYLVNTDSIFGNWGLIKLSDNPFHFGPDFGWFPTLEEAFLNSWMYEETNSPQ